MYLAFDLEDVGSMLLYAELSLNYTVLQQQDHTFIVSMMRT
jgi:hypothetical protein